jgi:hypothetical protein
LGALLVTPKVEVCFIVSLCKRHWFNWNRGQGFRNLGLTSVYTISSDTRQNTLQYQKVRQLHFLGGKWGAKHLKRSQYGYARRARARTRTHTHAHMHPHTHIHLQRETDRQTQTLARTHAHTQCARTRTHTRTYTCTHTHIHTHRSSESGTWFGSGVRMFPPVSSQMDVPRANHTRM